MSDNTAGGDGGGLYAYYDTSMVRSTVSGNTAGGRGGGIFSDDPSLQVSNSTIVANTAAVTGGGVFADGFELALDFVTFSANAAPGGSQIDLGGGTLRSSASVLADSVGGPACSQVVAVSAGHNYEQTTDSCGLRLASDVVNGGPTGLGALAANGGPTWTEAPAAASPLLDVMLAGEPGCSGADQRGTSRPQGGACDIGSVELVVDATGAPPGSRLAFVG